MANPARRAAIAAMVLYASAAAQTTTPAPTVSSTSTVCATILAPSYSPPVVAKGWKAQLVATGLTSPRGIKFDTNGGLLVIESGVGLTHLNFTDNGGTCLSLQSNKTVIAEKQLNHGLELSEDGKTLYVSTPENVTSYSYDPDAVAVSNMQRLVANMTNPGGGGHVTRTLLLSRQQPGLLLVSRGSSANMDELAADQSSGISQIRAFNISNTTGMAQPYNYPTDGWLVGWGLRNSVGVAEHPVTGGIWSVENSADDVKRLGDDIHQDNPGEELNFHGTISDPSTLGANHGYPSCFTLWNTTNFPSQGNLTVGSPFALLDNSTTSSTTSNWTDLSCARLTTPPRLTFQAHTAPLDIKFYQNQTNTPGAYITFHGSWDRDPPAGYKLSYIPFSSSSSNSASTDNSSGTGGEPTAASDSVSAAQDVLTPPDVTSCAAGGAGGCIRPAGLAFHADGERLFVTSDATGEVWVVVRDEGNQGGGGPVVSSSSSSAGGVMGGGKAGGVEGWVLSALTGLLMMVGGLL